MKIDPGDVREWVLKAIVSVVLDRAWPILRKLLNVLRRWIVDNWQLVFGVTLLVIVAYGAFAVLNTLWAIPLTLAMASATVLLSRNRLSSRTNVLSYYRGYFIEDFRRGLDNWQCEETWRTEKEDGREILVVTNSERGGIATPCSSWANYVFEFETKIVNENTSWIVRARDAGTYVMLQCGQSRLYPHFRVEGAWWELERTHQNPVPLPVVLPLNTWFGVRVEVRHVDVMVTLTVDGKDIVIPSIPTSLLKPPIAPMEYLSGTVGFRESVEECAHFRNVSVKRI